MKIVFSEKIKKLILKGTIVCPKTKERLQFVMEGDRLKLVSCASGINYPMHNDSIPILLANDQFNYEEYVYANRKMSQEYSEKSVNRRSSWLGRFYLAISSDYRTTLARQSFESIFADLGKDSLFLSIGGGPVRAHYALINLNIGPFPNVDIVADAHLLPFLKDCVDAISCNAVIEHLYDPSKAVAEMYNVLKPGGKVYAETPFMQAYHGYPYHYQNFTITGHRRLFEKQGFRIETSGVAVGPTYALMTLTGAYFYEYFPYPFNWILGKTNGLMARFIRPIDISLNKRSNSYAMASTTFLLASKPS